MLADKIWCYIGKRVDNDHILPDEDTIYTKFQYYFEALNINSDLIAEVVESYCGTSDLSGVEIRWEGELNGISHRRNLSEPTLPYKTA
jgi:hypothetical protein